MNTPDLSIQAEFDKALAAFTKAAIVLRDVMARDHTGDFFAAGYPRCLPSFDEFVAQVQDWKGHQDEAEAPKRIEASECGTVTHRRERNDEGNVTWYDDVITGATRKHERRAARVGVMRAWCGSRYGGETKQSFARSVASLISDVHSPFDCSPVHARWDVIY